MKYLFLLLFTTSVYAQEVYEVEGNTQDIKSKVLSWIGKSYKYPADVISFETDNQLVINAASRVKAAMGTDFKYRMTIEIKDGRYRVSFDDVKIDTGMLGVMSYEKSGNKALKRQIEEHLLAIELNLLESVKQEDNW